MLAFRGIGLVGLADIESKGLNFLRRCLGYWSDWIYQVLQVLDLVTSTDTNVVADIALANSTTALSTCFGIQPATGILTR